MGSAKPKMTINEDLGRAIQLLALIARPLRFASEIFSFAFRI